MMSFASCSQVVHPRRVVASSTRVWACLSFCLAFSTCSWNVIFISPLVVMVFLVEKGYGVSVWMVLSVRWYSRRP